MELARSGAHVIALARTQGALEDLDDAIRREGSEATLVPCDLKDFDALDRLGAAIFERWGKLDIFIGNAGVLGPLTPLAHIEPEQWAAVFAVNVTANWRLIRSLDPLLRASDAGRVVFISSSAGHAAHAKPYWGHSAVTKAALDALARTYAAETMNISNVRGDGRRSRAAADKNAGGGDARRRPDEPADTGRIRAETPCNSARRNGVQTGKLYDFQTDRVLSFMPPC